MVIPSSPPVKFPQLARGRRERTRRLLGGALFFRNGRSALLYSLVQFGLKPPDVILVPAYYCKSALQSIVAQGFKPVFIDVDRHLNIPLTTLRATLQSFKIKAVILVHFFGLRSRLREQILVICQDAGVKVIEDYCHSFLSFGRMQHHESPEVVAIFSIRKILPVADGGAAVRGALSGEGSVVNKFDWLSILRDIFFLITSLARLLLLRFGKFNPYGRSAEVALRAIRKLGSGGNFGTVGDLTAYPASPGLLLSGILADASYLLFASERRRINYAQLADLLSSNGVEVLFPILSSDDVPQTLPILDPSGTLHDFLRDMGIGVYRWPGGELPSDVSSRADMFPNSVRMNEVLVCLPIHQGIAAREISFILQAIVAWRRTITMVQ